MAQVVASLGGRVAFIACPVCRMSHQPSCLDKRATAKVTQLDFHRVGTSTMQLLDFLVIQMHISEPQKLSLLALTRPSLRQLKPY
jgi:hypothetical protein